LTSATSTTNAPSAKTPRPVNRRMIWGLVAVCVFLGGPLAAYLYHRHALRSVAEQADRGLLATRARGFLLEASLATRYGHYTMAFERTGRAQESATRLGQPMEREFASVRQALFEKRSDQEVVVLLLQLADQLERPLPLGQPDPQRKTPQSTLEQLGLVPAASAAAPNPAPTPAGVAPPTPTRPAPAPTTLAPSAPAPSTPNSAVPKTAVPPAPTTSSAVSPAPTLGAPSTPVAQAVATDVPALPKLGQSPEASFEAGRQALGQAKLLFLAGKGSTSATEALARAQVLLDESGKNAAHESISAAIASLRAGDEKQAQASIDTALAKLR